MLSNPKCNISCAEIPIEFRKIVTLKPYFLLRRLVQFFKIKTTVGLLSYKKGENLFILFYFLASHCFRF